MSITGLAITKGILATVGVATATGAAAVATGNAHGLVVAIQHIPSWTHAHTVLSHLSQGNSPAGKP